MCTLNGLPISGLESAASSGEDETKDMKAVAQGANGFALSLYSQISKDQGNLLFSPFSLSSALVMTYAGARGETARQMSNAMHFDLPPSRLHPAFQRMLEGLVSKPDEQAVKLLIANSLWGQTGFDFQEDFMNLVEDRYGAALRPVDFAQQTEEARVLINEWTSDRTAGKIGELLPSGSLDSRSRLVVVNAVYFNGTWMSPFQPHDTQEGEFAAADGQMVPAEFMQQSGRFSFHRDDTVQVLRLPYENDRISMIVLLPVETEGLPALESRLTLPFLNGLRAELKPQQVKVVFPKLRLQGRFSLEGPLKELGMVHAFSPREADFSGITGKRDLSIRAVLHQAVLELDEQGTEAAAATGLVLGVTSAPLQPPPLFKADHPFLFVIVDEPSGAILFAGRVSNPQG